MASERQRQGKKHSALYAPLSFLIICFALALGISVFCRVSSIEVTGNSLYTEQEIIEASGIETGDNLFFINKFTAVSRIFSKLPYVEQATISRALPNKLLIEVKEGAAIAYVEAEDGLWAIDRGCKILSRVSGGDTGSLIKVIGLSAIAPDVGETLAAGESEAAKVTYLSEILKRISALSMIGDVTQVDVSDISNPSFDYIGRFAVKLGSNDDLDYKFQLLLTAVTQLAEGDSGTLDLSIDKRAHLIYD